MPELGGDALGQETLPGCNFDSAYAYARPEITMCRLPVHFGPFRSLYTLRRLPAVFWSLYDCHGDLASLLIVRLEQS